MAPAQLHGGKNWKQNMSGGGARGKMTPQKQPTELVDRSSSKRLIHTYRHTDIQTERLVGTPATKWRVFKKVAQLQH